MRPHPLPETPGPGSTPGGRRVEQGPVERYPDRCGPLDRMDLAPMAGPG
ncbi:hypothetical protein LO763_21440 [Glycomyces sp. A-F 0318]|nr:hypothetical protein [Glycomyces amatae]MCD0446180.1 hypothetical protein [Glycomyces amatae]